MGARVQVRLEPVLCASGLEPAECRIGTGLAGVNQEVNQQARVHHGRPVHELELQELGDVGRLF